MIPTPSNGPVSADRPALASEAPPLPPSSISVVLPTHNRRPLLERWLETYLDAPDIDEVVLVLDGCDDGSGEWASARAADRGDDRLRVVELPERLRQPAARNAGIAAARGEFILFGEDDVVFGPGYASILRDALDDPAVGLAAGRLIAVGPDEDWDAAERRSRANLGRLEAGPHSMRIDYSRNADAPYDWPLPHACFLARRAAALDVRFDEAAFSGGSAKREESDFALRLAAAGWRLRFCPAAWAFHVRHSGAGGSRQRSTLVDAWWLVVNNWRFYGRHGQALSDALGWNTTARRLQWWWAARLSVGAAGRLAREACETLGLRRRAPAEKPPRKDAP